MNWMDLLYSAWMPKPLEQPWTPTYEPQQYVSEPNNIGTMSEQPVSLFVFATQATAEHLLAKYAPAGHIVGIPFLGPGPDSEPIPQRVIVWPNGVGINAGMLASIWTRNTVNPDIANTITLSAILASGAA